MKTFTEHKSKKLAETLRNCGERTEQMAYTVGLLVDVRQYLEGVLEPISDESRADKEYVADIIDNINTSIGNVSMYLWE